MENNICTILVNSCDSYEDTWFPFFKLLKKYWPDCSFPIVLNTETKSYHYKGLNIKTINLDKKYQNKKVEWGKRLRLVLEKINSKYILFMLDDFFLRDYVDSDKVNEIINWMEQDSNIAVFTLRRTGDLKYPDMKSTKYPHFYLRNKLGDYRYNCQIAIWNRIELIKSLRDFESAWDWELNGNYRSRRSKKDFYTLKDEKDYIFKYEYENCGVIRGKWRLPETKEFFDKENIKVDFSIRNNKEKNNKQTFTQKLINSIKWRINKLRSKL